MTKRCPALVLAVALCAGFLSAAPQAAGRYLDQIAAKDRETRLVIFKPDVFGLQVVATLRDLDMLGTRDFILVGVYHVRERYEYERSRKYASENGLDWVRFHTVSAEIDADSLFRRNACTPEFEAIVEKADGVILFGGPDLPPAAYKKKMHLLTELIDPYRHYLELSAVFHFLGGEQDPAFKPLLAEDRAFPILGICLGFQTLNVGTGGSLIQDIPSELYGKQYVEDVIAMGPDQWHRNPHSALHPLERLSGFMFHTISLNRKGKLCLELGLKADDHPRVLSAHHQAIDVLGKGLAVAAMSRDGRVIEAVEHLIYPNVLGVQFHPEIPELYGAGEGPVRQLPGEEPIVYKEALDSAPPSMEFHQRLWSWFGRKMRAHK